VEHESLTIVVGGDELALRVCDELAQTAGRRVSVLWRRDDELRARVERFGAAFVPRLGEQAEGLVAAGVLAASVIIALTDDDHVNLQIVLTARDLNPSIRIVLRQFSRTLGRKVEQNLHDCSVISLASHSAATYACAAVDASFYYGLQFPDGDGPLVGFRELRAKEAGAVGLTAVEAEARLGGRVVARCGEVEFARALPFDADDLLTVFARVRPRAPAVPPGSGGRRNRFSFSMRVRRALRQLDPVARGAMALAVAVFCLGTAVFGHMLHVDPFTAAYFVVETMTTTGYGDISARQAGMPGMLGAMLLMVAGVTFTGIFIAILSSRFTQAQYVAIQGLRHVSRRGHIIVCGAGDVGSRVIDYLLLLGREVVVVEARPKPEVVESARDQGFDLLTGDATKDTTLDLCNVSEATALIALTNSDTMNLEVALGARVRNPALTIVMRVQHESFQRSVRRHFGFYHTYGTAALAAPVFAGLSAYGGVRGRVTIGSQEYGVGEFTAGGNERERAGDGGIPLGVWRDGAVAPLAAFESARRDERVLMLYPLWQFRQRTSGGDVAGTFSEGAQ